jgi:CheY-like chemotaxis protein
LIEDDAVVRKLQKEVLEQLGYNVIIAANGEEALVKFVENRELIQLLLLDVIMPKKNGMEVYEEIRKIVPDIKVLFTSGYTADIIQRQGLLEKGQHLLSKPATPSELAIKLREIMDN